MYCMFKEDNCENKEREKKVDRVKREDGCQERSWVGRIQNSRLALISTILSKDLEDATELVIWIYGIHKI